MSNLIEQTFEQAVESMDMTKSYRMGLLKDYNSLEIHLNLNNTKEVAINKTRMTININRMYDNYIDKNKFAHATLSMELIRYIIEKH